jgi:hypothetical protein
MKVRFWRAGYFAWVIVLVAAWGAYRAYGLPHAIWSYSFYGGERGNTWSRHYTSCTFVGPYGVFTRNAVDGRCAWIAFFRDREAGQ